jgi:hypothetical protein
MRKASIIAVFLFASVLLISIAVFLIWRSNRAGSTGLAVRISTSQKTFLLGEPMMFNIYVVNTSLKTVKREFLAYCHDVFEIRGPNGSIPPYVVGLRQACGRDFILKPFRGQYVRTNLDILEEYAISQEGEYTIRIRKVSSNLPSSNKLRFMVKGGSSPVVDSVLDCIRPILPAQWRVGRTCYKFDRGPPPGRKGPNSIVIQAFRPYPRESKIIIRFTEQEAKEDTQRQYNYPTVSPFLGKNSFGYFYFDILQDTNLTWSTHEEDLIEALSLNRVP